jgi:uncharacterized protein GlcG (DUF336 family)
VAPLFTTMRGAVARGAAMPPHEGVITAEAKRASELKEADHETHVENGDGGGWCIHRCVDMSGGYIADASHSRSARGRSASETVAACARQGYRETAVVLDADGAVIAVLRGDGAGIHTLDSAHDKAYTSVSFKNDTLALAERAKGEDSIAPLAKLPHIMFFGGGVVIKLGDEVIGSIGAAGAPGAKLDDSCAHAGLDKIRERLK